MVSSYNLLSTEKDTATYLLIEHLDNAQSKITYVLNIKELIEHSQYQLTAIDTNTGLQQYAILHATLLNTNNLYIFLFNCSNNVENLLQGIEVDNE